MDVATGDTNGEPRVVLHVWIDRKESRVDACEKQVRSARGFKRVGRHSAYAI
jgi:hypothetical protein